MESGKGKPMTRSEAALILAYLVIALGRQVHRDLRTIIRWANQ